MGGYNFRNDEYRRKSIREGRSPSEGTVVTVEFVTPPKYEKFKNKNLSVIRNRDKQRRAVLGLPDYVV